MVSISAQTVVIDIVTQVKDKTSEGMEKAKSGINKLGNALKKVQQRFDKLRNSNSELSIKDRATQIIEKTSKGLKNITQKVWSITLTAMDKVTAPIKGIFNLIKNPLSLTVSLLGLETDVGDIFNTFLEFQQSMNDVQAAMGYNTAEDIKAMDSLAEKAREMGRETTKSASEAAKAMEAMASAGWDQETIEIGIKPVLRLSEASGMELEQISELVTGSMDSMGLQAEQLEGYLDKVAKISEKSKVDIGQLMESFMEIGDTVKQNNVPLEEAGALIGVLANQDITGSEAGVALNSVLVNLTTGAGKAGEAMEKLNLSAFHSDGSFKGYAEILKELHDKIKNMTEEQKSYYLTAIGGEMPLSDLQKLLSGVSEEYDNLKDEIVDSKGALESMGRVKNDNLCSAMDALQNAFGNVKTALVAKLEPYIRKFVQWLTKAMHILNGEIEKTMGLFVEKISNMEKRIGEFTNMDQWKNADLFGKISIAWDEFIIQPFSEWWSGTGKAWFVQKAGEIGNIIGKSITFGMLVMLGFRPKGAVEGAMEGGISIGASFAEGFAKGFDGKKVIEAILEGMKGIVKNAATLFPGGEKASASSLLSTGLLAYGGMKIGKGIAGIGSFMTGGSTIATGAGLLGSAGSGTGLFGLGSNTAIALGAGNLAGGASLSAGALSAVGLSSIAGGALGMAGLADAVKDFKKGNTERGLVKTGMVGGGAAIGATIGTLIFPGLGTLAGGLIGSGIGGIGALLKGDTVGDWFHETFTKKGREEKEKRELEQQKAMKQAEKQAEKEEKIRKEKERQLAIEKQINRLKDTKLEINNTREQIFATNRLKDAWSDIRKELESGLLTEEEKVKKQEELKSIVSQLSELYPELIDASDSENGKLDEKLEKIQNMNELERERQKLLLENLLMDANRNLGSILNDLNASNENLDRLRERQQMLKEKRMDFESDVSEFGVLEQELIRAKNTGEDPVVIQKYEDQVQNQEQKMEKNLQNIGIEISYDEIFEMIPMDTEFSRKDIHHFSYTKENVTRMLEDEQKINNSKQELEIQNNQKLQDQLQEIYDAELQLMELELNMPIEEAAKSYETMGETQKKVFDKILDDLFNLNSEFQNFIDQPKHMDILLNFIPEKAKLLEENKEVADHSKIESTEPVTPHAMGGILTRPHIGMVAEAGAEAIIPLTGMNKERGKKLWEQAGRILGMFPNEKIYAHAQGGIFGDISKNRALQSPVYDAFFSDEEETESKKTPSDILVPIEIGGIHLGGMNFTFNGAENGDRESIMRTIREQMPEIAEEVAEEMAKVLQKKFANMKSSVA